MLLIVNTVVSEERYIQFKSDMALKSDCSQLVALTTGMAHGQAVAVKMPMPPPIRPVSKRDVSPRVFLALQNLDVDSLAECSEEGIRPIIPCLARMSLIIPLDQSPECAQSRRMVSTILSGREIVNSIVGLLSIDFHALEVDVKKEQLLR